MEYGNDLSSTQVMIDTSEGPRVFTYCKDDKTLTRGDKHIILGDCLDVGRLEKVIKDVLRDEQLNTSKEIHININPIYYHLEQEGYYE